jgi:thiamine biosynthesis lipoprotein
VGSDNLLLAPMDRAGLARAGMSVDLGGIAKGYAIDRVAERWRAQGVEGALISFGESSTIAIGDAPGAAGWRLALRDATGELAWVVELRDQAFSVSSSLSQGSEIQGRRFGHVVDPRTGMALERSALAAVAADDATSAEIWSKAALVLPAQHVIEMLDPLDGPEAWIAAADGSSLATSGWQSATHAQPMAPAEEPK